MEKSKVIEEAQIPTAEAVPSLLSWRPPGGVFSIYAAFDPADRGGAWWIELREGLREAAGRAGGDRDSQLAARATAERLEQTLAAEHREAGRGLIGFVEAGRERGEERWFVTEIPPRATEVHHAERPQVGPLLAILDDGAPIGVAVLSSEKIRLFDAHLGRLEKLHDWELELFSGDWRERKAPASRDPGAGQMTSAAGRDQYRQRLNSNRDRFVHQAGGLARADARKLGWRTVLAFGDDGLVSRFEEGLAGDCPVSQVASTDLISVPAAQVAERVRAHLPELNRARERELIERVKEAAYSKGRSSFGPRETLQALEQGRAEHLIYDSGLETPDTERLIELAIASGAAVTPVEGAAAAELSEQGGVAALLRY
ncbi:MAG: VLRF1 family aeRF1-type release factor [Solirubrobacterales bacterium]